MATRDALVPSTGQDAWAVSGDRASKQHSREDSRHGLDYEGGSRVGRTRGNQRNLRAFFGIIVPTPVGAAAVALWYSRVVLGICAGMGLPLLAKPYIEGIAQVARVIH